MWRRSERRASRTTASADVPWEFASAEGEGDRDIDDWRAGHLRFWTRVGEHVTDDSAVVCEWFELVEVTRDWPPS